MYKLQRNSRGEWCACIEREGGAYETVHSVRMLVPIPGTEPDSSSEYALEQMRKNIDLIRGVHETRFPD